MTSYTRRMTYTPTGEAFPDYLVESVGVLPFQTLHDLFIAEDLEIRTAAGGGGTLLIEPTDYTLSGEDLAISDLITAAIGSGRRAMRYITIINVAYQACDLYISGKHVCDQFDKEDGGEIVTLVDEDYTIPDNTHDVVIDLTTVATEREVTIGALARNLGRKITVQMNNASIAGYEAKLIPPAGEHFFYVGAEYDNLYVGLPGQRVTLQVRSDGIYILGGVVQPVALEPDIGGGWHHISDANRTATLVVDTSTNTAGVWSAAVSMPNIPDGVKKTRNESLIVEAASAPVLNVEAASGFTLSNTTIGTNFYKYEGSFMGSVSAGLFVVLDIPLDLNKQFKWVANVSGSTVQIGSPIDYLLGPA